MKYDLHNHSFYSDGRHSPEFVVERACARGVSHLALTDHDCVEGILHLRQQPLSGITLVPGVEISTLWNGLEIHIVGLCVDPLNRDLTNLLEHQQQKRLDRADQIHKLMNKAGIAGLNQYLDQQQCVAPTRTHIVDFLISTSKTKSRKHAFKALTRNGRFFVKSNWCSVAEAVSAIHQANGLAVIAHPHRYRASNSKLRRLLSEFKNCGGDAMEVCYSNVSNDIRDFLGDLSVENELYASSGSDFHNSDATWMDIGKIPSLPENCKKNAIWLHSRWHL